LPNVFVLRPILTGVAAGVGLRLLVIEDASVTYRRAINRIAPSLSPSENRAQRR